jgi:hypothetical protein
MTRAGCGDGRTPRSSSLRVVGHARGGEQDPDMICEVFVLAPTELVGGDELRPGHGGA